MLRHVLYFLLFSATLLTSTQTLAERPKIGLVLSGGGARGAAHIGVLKVLEENRIPVDYIAGTSMGSIVGGLYASGMKASEIEQVMYQMDWDDKLSDAPDRADTPMVRKEIEDHFSVEGRPGIRGGEVLLPRGFIQGQKILPELQRLTAHVDHIRDFARLPIPFTAVATDIVTGKMVLLDRGELAVSMRASMAVPSIFAPVKVGEALLVDGGLTNNLPVDIVKAMGADIIIAVDISSPYLSRDEMNNVLDVTSQLTNILTRVNADERLAMLTDNDILIVPALGDIGSGDFHRAEDAVPIGAMATEAQLQSLAALQLNNDDYDQYLLARAQIPETSRIINRVAVTHNSNLDDDIIRGLVKTKAGENLSLETVEQDIKDIYALGNFESVAYSLDHTADGIDLTLDAAAKSWGPNYLYLGLEMSGDLTGNNLINLSTGYSREEITKKGGIWTTMATIGDEPALATHLYLPMTGKLGPFVSMTAGYESLDQSIFEDDEQIAEYRRKQFNTSIAAGWEFNQRAVIQLGIDRIHGKAERLVGDFGLPEPEYDDGGLYLQYKYDSLDNPDFPSAGTALNLWARKAFEELGADQSYEQYQLQFGKALAFNNHRLVLSLHAGITEGTSTIAGLYRIGGGPLLLGLQHGQLIGDNMAVAQIYYYKEYEPFPFLSGYIGGLLEYGGVYEDRSELFNGDSITSGAIWFAFDTPAGPLQVGLGGTDDGDVTYFTRIGHLF